MNSAYPWDALLAILAVTVLLGGWFALWQARRSRQRAGLPAGRLVYADTGDWRPPDAPLFSANHRLTGRPDYLVATAGGLIPIEVKSSATPAQPYLSHVLQLAAYCLLVEDSQGQAPPYGLIKYTDAVFQVNYTPALRQELLAMLNAIRRWRAASSGAGAPDGPPRSHAEPQRCAGCGYRPWCNQSMV